MSTDHVLQLVLRFLPSVILLALGFLAAADKKTRERWADLLYQAGSVRPEQRQDLKVQRGVRLPFFVLALGLLILPIRYYRWATTKLEVTSNIYSLPKTSAIYGQKKEGAGAAVAAPDSTPTAAPGSSAPLQSAPLQAAPGAPSAPLQPGAPAPLPGGQRKNIYGKPMP